MSVCAQCALDGSDRHFGLSSALAHPECSTGRFSSSGELRANLETLVGLRCDAQHVDMYTSQPSHRSSSKLPWHDGEILSPRHPSEHHSSWLSVYHEQPMARPKREAPPRISHWHELTSFCWKITLAPTMARTCPAFARCCSEYIKGSAVLKSVDLSLNKLCGIDAFGEGTYDPSGIQLLAAAAPCSPISISDLMILGLQVPKRWPMH